MARGAMAFVRAMARANKRNSWTNERRQLGYAVKRYKRLARMLSGRKGRNAKAWSF